MSEERELYSLLIPLLSERLLVPRACVAEVIALADSPTRPNDNVPDWFIGTVDWNGRRLPVISLDDSMPQPAPGKRNRRRIVVFHGVTEHMRGKPYGILTQGFPQLVRVNRDVLSVDSETPLPANRPIVCRARMIHEYPLIPDVYEIERMVAELPPY